MQTIKNMILGNFLILLGFICLFINIAAFIFLGYILIATGIVVVLINYTKRNKGNEE